MKIKKIICLMIIIVALLSNSFVVYADDEIEEQEELTSVELQEASSQVNNEPQINSRAAIVYDKDADMVLYEKNIYSKKAMASTTKIMTAIIVLENSNLNETVTISKKAGAIRGSRLGLSEGDKVTVRDLLYGLMLKSGNDAAVALAEHIGGSVEGFAVKMNEKVKELKLSDTNFVTPHGLDNEKHYTTVYSLARLTDYALDNKIFREVVQTKNCTININGHNKNISNTNELLGVLNGVYGVKTGFTNNAGRCLVSAVKRDNLNIIVIVLGADTKKNRTIDSIKLIEYTYKNFEKINIKERVDEEFKNWKEENINIIKVNKGVSRIKSINNKSEDESILQIELSKLDNDFITVKKNRINSIKILINSISEFEAPLKQGEIIGTLKIVADSKLINTINIINKKEIKKKNIIDYMFLFFEQWY